MSESNYSKLLALGIPLRKASGQTKTICPKCSHNRAPANRKEACLSVNIDTGEYSCWNSPCDFQGSVNHNPNYVPKKQYYIPPAWQNNTPLPDGLVKWWATRGIGQQTLIQVKLGVGIEYMPYPGAQIWTMQFPYFRKGELVNIKYRGDVDTGERNPDGSVKFKKAFKMVTDAEKIFYNLDAIENSDECLVVEGEPDCLSFMEAGYPFCVSVPNGATTKNNNLSYLDNCIEYFENKKKIYIGVDNDEAGRALQAELIRRLGAERCWILDYADCKDGNAYLVKYGKLALAELPSKAKGAVIEGIVEIADISNAIDDLWQNGMQRGLLVGIKSIDELISFPSNMFVVVTGVSNHGKSPFMDFIVARLVVQYNLKCAYFSPENEPNALHAAGIISLLTGKSFERKYGATNHITHSELQTAKSFMQEHYYFISQETNEGHANQFHLDNFTVDAIFDYAKKMVFKYGINILVIDPWNTLDHLYAPGQDKLDYISKALDKFRKFARKYNVLTVLIAHPTKMLKEVTNQKDDQGRQKKKYAVPDLSNVADSNHFHNKPDAGITVYRDYDLKETDFIVNKMKHRHIGRHGNATFVYDWISGRFNAKLSMPDKGNWLVAKPAQQGYNEPASVLSGDGQAAAPIVTATPGETTEMPF